MSENDSSPLDSGSPRIAFVFVDGVGVGISALTNPLSTGTFPGLRRLAGSMITDEDFGNRTEAEWVVRRLDASLGLPGLPQSGTGQASLFTGVNCARLAGRHYGPYPHSKTRVALHESNVFQRCIRAGVAHTDLAFANAYPDRFFEYAGRHDRWTVTTRCCLDAQIEIRTMRHLFDANAVPADLTGDGFKRIDIPFPAITPSTSGRIFARIVRSNRFSLFEYFMTDKAGHSMDAGSAHIALSRLDEFISTLIDDLDFSRDLLLLTSDHGNIEDLSVRTHTHNLVPFVAMGRHADKFSGVATLTDVVEPCIAVVSAA